MSAAISTAVVVVCGNCGRVSHVEGTVPLSSIEHEFCPGTLTYSGTSHGHSHGGRHAWKHVLVIVPWA